jgi:hypothetical protein
VLRSSRIARAVAVSSLSFGALLAGCGGDDIPGSDVPEQDSAFNDAITERPDDGVDSTKVDGGTDGGSDGGTDTLVAEGGDTATTEGGTDAAETSAETGTFVEITVGGTSFTFSPAT